MADTPKRAPRFLTVKQARYLTPNMIRVTFSGPELAEFPLGREGANCKLVLPDPDDSRAAFEALFADGGPAGRVRPVRTYTIRAFRPEVLELDIDFVAHGDNGPAARWAMAARSGSFLGLMGPGPVKLAEFYADWYLVAADMSALPVAAAALEAMPRDAKGIAIFEVLAADDRQDIDMPAGIEAHWLVQDDPHHPPHKQIDFLRELPWREGVVQTCIAGETGVVRALRDYVQGEQAVPRKDNYISGYWKIGMVEDEHQAMKRAETDAA